ncbi:methylmalonyl Co-A mutase-associated GTPase MeaB [bacterium]|nr:methylmalonyl Co-A mutase-associated GTPase MeaB [bacterium]
MFYTDVIKGDVRATAKLIRKVDDQADGYLDELKAIYPHTGNAFIIGVTGNPGAGKSTLVNQLIKYFRGESKKVGIVAIDPTSPFSGGAILGDRIRMQKYFNDEGVFIRSVATRGNLGGLSRSTGDIIKILDAMGNDIVIIETVGVGQDEIDICKIADLSIVVLVPGMGDHIQAIKAGIMEIADVFVLNKADLSGADRTISDVNSMLMMDSREKKPPVLKTIAEKGEGIKELIDTLYTLRDEKNSFCNSQNFERKKLEFSTILNHLIQERVDSLLTESEKETLLNKIMDGETNPYKEAEMIVDRIFRNPFL